MDRVKRNIIFDALIPLSGFLVCFFIWISLPKPAKVIGGIWLIIGFIYLIIRTRGLKKNPVIIDFKEV